MKINVALIIGSALPCDRLKAVRLLNMLGEMI